MAAPNEITPSQLSRLIGTPEAPVIIDVSIDPDFEAADTNRHDLAPQAAGVLAMSVGLSRQYRDDQAQLRAGLALFDALYRWARDGANEGQDWPAGHTQ